MSTIRHVLRWDGNDGTFEFELNDSLGRLVTGDGQILELSRDGWIKLNAALAQAMAVGKAGPENAGKPWTRELDAELARLWRGNTGVPALAKHFLRTRGAISSRLERLGLIAGTGQDQISE